MASICVMFILSPIFCHREKMFERDFRTNIMYLMLWAYAG